MEQKTKLYDAGIILKDTSDLFKLSGRVPSLEECTVVRWKVRALALFFIKLICVNMHFVGLPCNRNFFYEHLFSKVNKVPSVFGSLSQWIKWELNLFIFIQRDGEQVWLF